MEGKKFYTLDVGKRYRETRLDAYVDFEFENLPESPVLWKHWDELSNYVSNPSDQTKADYNSSYE